MSPRKRVDKYKGLEHQHADDLLPSGNTRGLCAVMANPQVAL